MKKSFFTLFTLCLFTSITSAQTLTMSMKGEYANNLFGYAVANAGDIDKDGYNDLIVGAYRYSSDRGKVYIYTKVGTITILGQSAGERFGISVACAGDVNKDSYVDIIVGAYTYNGYYGRAYIFFGNAGGINTSPDVTITSPGGTYLGYSVASAGDVNKDGCDDVIVGAPGFSAVNNFMGKAYIYYGSTTMTNNPSPNVTLQTGISQDYFGYSVAGAGDINKDGHSDVIVGGYGYGVVLAPSNYWGSAYVYLGGTITNSIADFIVYGASGKDNKLGYCVAGAGDVNFDGYADFLVGAPGANTNACYVYYGSKTVSNLSRTTINGPVAGGWFGFSVNKAYDTNQDFYDDIVIGAPLENSGRGKTYIYYGGNTIGTTSNLSIAGENTSDYFGYAVAGVGDLDRNASYEFLIGAPYHDPDGRSNAGKSYVISGIYRELKYITLTPATATLTPYATCTFSAEGHDQYGDTILYLTYIWETMIGSLSTTSGTSTVFRAGTTALTGTLTVRVGTLTAVATITIPLGTLSYIIITPATLMIQSLGTKSFEVKGYDSYGNFIPDLSFIWNTNIGTVSMVVGTSTIFTATNTTLVGILTATYGTITGIATISICAPVLTYIIITPATFTLLVNATSTFTAQGYDQYNQEMAGLTYLWGTQIGTVSSNTGSATIFTAGTRALTGTLAVTSGSVTVVAMIKIIPGTLSYITITPATATVFVKSAKPFFAQGYDGYHNPIPDLTYTWQTQIGSIAPTTGSQTVFIAGSVTFLIGTLTATSGTITATASITITSEYGDIITPLKYLIALKGHYQNEKFGISVAGNGDINGDGFDDVVVGAPNYNSNQGRVYIYFGNSVLDDTADIILGGEAIGINFGISVAIANVNNDIYDDVIVGAHTYNGHYGRVYVYYGPSLTSNLILTGSAYEFRGYSVANAGDINRDGYEDIIVGAPGFSAGNNFMGKAYVYYGSSSMDTTVDVTFASGISQDLFGYSVAGVGDMNKDGHSDVIVGAYSYGVLQFPSNYWGSAYVFYGGTITNAVADMITYGIGGDLKLGYSVGAAGDINKDGYADAIVGAPGIDANACCIYYGTSGSLSGNPDVIFYGSVPNSSLGFAVDCVGDVNNEGFDDVVIGAPFVNSFTGKFYTYYGGNPIDTLPDIGMPGENSEDYFGYSVAGGGDVNHDGAPETIISAPYNDDMGANFGKVYIITGIPKTLSYVKITPATTTVVVDGTLTFTAQGYDEYDNPIADLIYNWNTIIGSISPTTGKSIIFTAGTKALIGTLSARSDSFIGFGTITIIPGTLSYIIITPGSITLPYSGTQTFTAQGYDKYGNPISNLCFYWNTKIGNLSTITGTAVRFIAGTIAQTGTLSATYGTITGFATITMATATFTYILITPGTPTIEVDGTISLTAQGYDQYWRPISGLSYSWQVSLGSLSTNSGTSTIFTAGTITLIATVTVTSGSITGFATITIVPGTLTYIIINPATVTLTVDGTRTFTGYGYDKYNNYNPNLIFNWQTLIGSLSSTSGSSTLFTAGTRTVEGTLSVYLGTLTTLATITIIPGTLTQIIIMPGTTTVVVDGTRTFTAYGYDTYFNFIPELVFNWNTFIGSVSSGIGSATIFTAGTRALEGTLGVSLGSITTLATITIIPGTLSFILIDPATATLELFGSKTFTVRGFDIYSNFIDGLFFNWLINIGSISPTTGTNTLLEVGTKAGLGSLTVLFGSITTYATINVLPGTLSYIILDPTSAIVVTGSTRTFTALGYDIYHNFIPDIIYVWETTIGSVTANSAAVFNAGTSAGMGTLTVRHGSISTFATITVIPGTLTYIIINPASVTVLLFGTQTFTASGYDKYMNFIPGLIFDWNWTIGSITVTKGTLTVFIAGTTGGIGSLTAFLGSITTSATITIKPGTLSYIVIYPSTTTVVVDSTRTFTAKGYDEFNNLIPELIFNWGWTIGSVNVSSGTQTEFYAGTKTGVGSLSAHYGTITSSATITVNPGTLSYMVMTPGSATLVVEGTLSFTAQGYDRFDNLIPELIFNFGWTIGSVNVSIGTQTEFYAGTKTGIGSLSAHYGTITTYATITVNPGTLSYIVMTPNSATLIVEGTLSFTAKGYDRFDNFIPELIFNFGWTIGSVNVSIGTQTEFYAGTKTGVGSLSATYGTITIYATITINPGTLSYIVMTPGSASMVVEGTLSFTAKGYDRFDNFIAELIFNWGWTIGSVNVSSGTQTGFYAGTKTGIGSLSAHYGTITTYATITVNPGTLSYIVMTPGSASMVVEGTLTWTAKGYDRFDNFIPELIFNFGWTIGSVNVSIGTQTVFYAGTKTGVGSLSAIYGTITTFATITINPGTLSYMVMTPGSASLVVEGTLSFTAKGYDRFDNFIPELIFNWGWNIGSVNVSIGTQTEFYAGTKTGIGSLSAHYGTITSYATITVNPGTLSYIVMTPGSASMVVEGTLTWTAKGYDRFDNFIPELIFNFGWTIGSVNVSIGTQTVFYAGTKTGVGSLSAIYGTITTFATITINPGTLSYMVMTPGSASLVVEGTLSFTAKGYDRFDNFIPELIFNWGWNIGSVNVSIGTQTEFYAGTKTGIGSLSAHYGTITSYATITVNPGTLSYIVMTPGSATLVVEGTLSFTSKGYDRFDNLIPELIFNFGWTIGSVNVSIGTQTVFYAGTKTGIGSLSAHYGTITSYATITVNPGTLSYIVMIPGSASLVVEGTLSFTAKGYDRFDNLIPELIFNWGWTIGSVNVSSGTQTGFYAGTKTGIGSLSAHYGTITSYATITVNPGTLSYIVMMPGSATLVVEGTLSWTAKGYDRFDNLIPELIFNWGWTIGSVNVNIGTQTEFYAGTKTGIGSLSAHYGTITTYATITVNPGTLGYIMMTPDSASLVVEGTLTWTAKGYDRFDNLIPELIFNWECTIGSISVGTQTTFYAGTRTGIGSLSATYGTITSYATITINPGTLSYIIIIPASSTLSVEGSLTFTAKGYDIYHNLIEDILFSWATSIGSVYPSSGTNTLFIPGTIPVTGTLTAKYGNIINSATITLIPGTISYIIISPASVTLTVNGSCTFTAQGYDRFNNLLSGLLYQWEMPTGTFSNTIGSLTTFTAGTTAMLATLTVRVDAVIGTATVNIIKLIHIWPEWRYNSTHTGRSDYTGPCPVSIKGTYTTLNTIRSSPAIANDGTIYVGSDDYKLYAINPDGNLKWSYPTGDMVSSSPAIGPDGVIYVGSPDTYLYAIFPNGQLKWRYKTNGWIESSPVVGEDGNIYVGSYDEYLYVISPDGTLKWRYYAGGWVHSSPAIGTDGTVYVGSYDKKLHAVNPNGTNRWIYTTGKQIDSSPAIDTDGTIYIGSDDYNLYAINPDGSHKWIYSTGHWVKSSPAIGTDGTIYVGSYDKKLYAINPNGSQKWAYETGGWIKSSPVIGSDSTIYIGSYDGYFYAITPQGNLKWRYPIGSAILSSPAIGTGNTIYVGANDNKLYSLAVALSPASISITPGSATIGVDGTLTFEANAFDATGKPIYGLLFNWSVTIGSLATTTGPWTTFIAGTSPITGTLTLTCDSLSATALITVIPGTISYISIIPSTATLGVNRRQLFTAQGYDVHNNSIPDLEYRWQVTIGTLTATTGATTTFISGTNPVTGTLTVTVGTVSKTAIIEVFKLDHIWPGWGYDYKHNAVSSYAGPSPVSLLGSYTTGGLIHSGCAVGHDGVIYFGSTDKYLYAINRDGSLKWRYLTGNMIYSSPAIDLDGTIYIGSTDNYLYAIKPDGSLKWRYETDNMIYSSPAIGPDGTIYIGSYDKKLHAINPDGTFKWSYETGGWIYSSPAVNPDGTVYVGSYDRKLHAISSTGTLQWVYTTGDRIESSPAIGTDGTVYVGSNDTYLYALNSNGTLHWRYKTNSWVKSSPAIGKNGTIYVGSYDNYLYAIKPDGNLHWRYATGNWIESSPIVGTDGTIYVGSYDKKLYAILPDGNYRWSYLTSDIIESSPAMGSNATAYINSTDGKMYMLGQGGPPAYIQITPATTSIAVGGTISFTAQGYDESHTAIPGLDYLWATTIGRLSSTSGQTVVFTAGTTTLIGTLSAWSGTVTTMATITVIPGSLTNLVLIPATASLTPQGTMSFSTQGYDRYGNAIPNLGYTWQTEIGTLSQGTGSLTIFTAGTTALTGTLAVTSGTITTFATITITPDTLTYIRINPGTITLSIYGTQTFTAHGYDIYWNHINISCTWTTTIGSISPTIGSLTVFVAGTRAITGTLTFALGSLSDTATITIVCDPLNYLLIYPATASLTPQGTMSFSTQGYDRYGNAIPNLSYTWQTEIGTLSQETGSLTIFTAGTTALTGTLAVTSGTITTFATITITPDTLTYIRINPGTITLSIYGTQTFTAHGYDIYWNHINISCTWTTTIGSISPTIGSMTVFVAGTRAITGTLTFAFGSLSDTATITIVCDPLNYLLIYPATASLTPQGTMTFSTQGYDRYGNAISNLSYAWQIKIGTLSQETGSLTIFTAGTTALTGTLAVTSGTITTSATITITPGTLTYIRINPGTITLSIYGTQTFTAHGYDAYWNHIDINSTWTTRMGSISPTSGSWTLFVAGTIATTGTLTFIHGSLSDTATITITPDPLNYIRIYPASATLMPVGTQAFTTQGYDQYGNEVPNLTYQWNTLIGTLSQITGTYTLFTAGTTALTGTLGVTSGSVTCLATITITPGTLSYIIIYPATTTLPLYGSQTFTARGYDGYGNFIDGLIFNWLTTIGSISPSAGSSTFIQIGTMAGIGSLTAIYGTITTYATITVLPGTLSYIIIDPASATLTVAGTKTFMAKGYDVYHNQIPGLIFTWQTNIGSVSLTSGTQTLFTATTTPITGTLTASFGSITVYATI
ncbi:MAG: PQQ-binding-like beta-propeller repeat protein, partial [bacterium]